jgi:O-antigen/teichoic acid export membrane protein
MTKPVFATLLTRALQISTGFVGTVLTARFLGPDLRGQYFFVVTLSLIVVQFANLGLHASNTYYVARDERWLGPLVDNSIWVSLIAGAGGGAAAVVFVRVTALLPTPHSSLLWFSVALPPAILFFMLGTNLLVGVNRIGTFNLFETFANLLVVAALVTAGVAAFRLSGFLAMTTAAWTISSVALLVYLAQGGRTIAFHRRVFMSGVVYGAKAYAIAALGYLVLRSNVFLLQRFDGARVVGYYSVAAQIADVLAMLPASVALVLFPKLVRAEHATRWQQTIRTCAIVAAVLAALCAVAAVAAAPFVRLAFGNAYAPAIEIVRVMLPGVFALGTTMVLSQFLASIGMPRLNVLVWVVALGAVLVLGAVLIPGHGAVGAASALSITYWLVLALIGAVAYRHRGESGRALAEKPVTALDELEWVPAARETP